MTGYRPETAVLRGKWNADNSLRLLLNGIQRANTTTDWPQIENFSISEGFVPGVNTLEFVVTNDPSAGGHNPTAFFIADFTGEAERGNPDDFDNRILLEGSSGQVTADGSGATSQVGEPIHGDGATGATLWWRWKAPDQDAEKLAIFDTAGSDFDTILAVYTGATLNDLSLVAANDDLGTQSRTSLLIVVAGLAQIL